MVLTLKKIQHRCAGRNDVVFPYSAVPHYSNGQVQKVIAASLKRNGLSKKGRVHNLLHSSIKTTMIYTYVSNKAINRIHSPLVRLNMEIENTSKKI